MLYSTLLYNTSISYIAMLIAASKLNSTRASYNMTQGSRCMAATACFCGFPQGLNQEEFHPGKLQGGFHLATEAIRSLKKSMRHTLYEHPEPLWQHFREWRTYAPFQNLQLITGLLSSTVNLVHTYQKPIGY